jgi:hypothetical protein
LSIDGFLLCGDFIELSECWLSPFVNYA